MAALEVASRAVVAHVELGPPGAVLVEGVAAADPTRLRPGHLRVVADTGLEPVGGRTDNGADFLFMLRQMNATR